MLEPAAAVLIRATWPLHHPVQRQLLDHDQLCHDLIPSPASISPNERLVSDLAYAKESDVTIWTADDSRVEPNSAHIRPRQTGILR